MLKKILLCSATNYVSFELEGHSSIQCVCWNGLKTEYVANFIDCYGATKTATSYTNTVLVNRVTSIL